MTESSGFAQNKGVPKGVDEVMDKSVDKGVDNGVDKGVDNGERRPIALFCSATGVGHLTPLLAAAMATAERCPDVTVIAFTAVRDSEVGKCGNLCMERAPRNFVRHERVLEDVDPVTMEGMIRYASAMCNEAAELVRSYGGDGEGDLRVIVHDVFALHGSKLSRDVYPNVPTYLFAPSPGVAVLSMLMAVGHDSDEDDSLHLPGLAGPLSRTNIFAGIDLERHPDPSIGELKNLFGRNIRGVIANDSPQSFPTVPLLLKIFAQRLITRLQNQRKSNSKQTNGTNESNERNGSSESNESNENQPPLSDNDPPDNEDLVMSYSAEDFEVYSVQEALSEFRKPLQASEKPSKNGRASENPLDQTIAWMDKCEPATVTVVCFGTLYVPTDETREALDSAIEEIAGGEGQLRFVYVSKDSKVQERFEGLDKVRVVPWAPLLEIFGHEAIRVLITHGGWNTLQENLYYSARTHVVPMILLPLGSDQFVNAEIVAKHFKVGISALKHVTQTVPIVGTVETVGTVGTVETGGNEGLDRVGTPVGQARNKDLENGINSDRLETNCLETNRSETNRLGAYRLGTDMISTNVDTNVDADADLSANVEQASNLSKKDLHISEMGKWGRGDKDRTNGGMGYEGRELKEYVGRIDNVIEDIVSGKMMEKAKSYERKPDRFRFFNRSEWITTIADNQTLKSITKPKTSITTITTITPITPITPATPLSKPHTSTPFNRWIQRACSHPSHTT